MNINRNQPPQGPRADLEYWLSEVLNDAMYDARKAGMSQAWMVHQLRSVLRHEEILLGLVGPEMWAILPLDHGLRLAGSKRESAPGPYEDWQAVLGADSSADHQHFGRVLDLAMKAMGLLNADVARHTDASIPTVAGWRVGRKLPFPEARRLVLKWLQDRAEALAVEAREQSGAAHRERTAQHLHHHGNVGNAWCDIIRTIDEITGQLPQVPPQMWRMWLTGEYAAVSGDACDLVETALWGGGTRLSSLTTTLNQMARIRAWGQYHQRLLGLAWDVRIAIAEAETSGTDAGPWHRQEADVGHPPRCTGEYPTHRMYELGSGDCVGINREPSLTVDLLVNEADILDEPSWYGLKAPGQKRVVLSIDDLRFISSKARDSKDAQL